MSRISALGFADGFGDGFDRSERFHNNQDRKQRIDRVDALAAEDRIAAQERQVKQDALAADALAYSRSRDEAGDAQKAAEAQALAEYRMGTLANQKASADYIKQKDADTLARDNLKNNFSLVMQQIGNGVTPDNLNEYIAETERLGMDVYNPMSYRDGKTKETAAAMNKFMVQAEAGDYSFVNTPEFNNAYSRMYASQIKQGITGDVVAKTFAGFDKAGDGRVTPMVNVIYKDGWTDRKPITAGRTGDENDPVASVPIGDIVDDLKGRIMIADLANSPLFQQQLSSIKASSKAEPLSNEGKMIDDLIGYGVPKEKAVGLATKDPSTMKNAIEYWKSTGGPYGEPTITLDEAIAKVSGDGSVPATNGHDFSRKLDEKEESIVARIKQANDGWDATTARKFAVTKGYLK